MMIEGRSIICFAHDWEGDPTSKTHIMRILSKRNRILWVNSIGMRRPSASGRDLRRIWGKLLRSARGCLEVAPNLFVVNPLVVPLPGVVAVDKLNTVILTASLRWFCSRYGLDRPILWTFLPNVNRLLGRLDEQLVIYHCVDEYSAFSGVPQDALRQMEMDLLQKANLIFCSSEELHRARKAVNPHTFFIPHGVDVTHFSKAVDPHTRVPESLRKMRHPIIGFFGLIADWIDLDLIRKLALARPEWSFVLVGKVITDTSRVKELKNVFLIGQQSYGSLPGFCKAFDVGIIPFRINELTLKANPLKLREYLAAGLPVVSTDLPEVRKYNEIVHLALSVDEFIVQLEASLHERDGLYRARRIEAMQRESWEACVERLATLIHPYLESPGDGVGGRV